MADLIICFATMATALFRMSPKNLESADMDMGCRLRLYVAETPTARVFYWDLDGPGSIDVNPRSRNGGHFLAGLPGLQMFDSLAVDGDGNVCVATLINGGITVISPEGEILEHVATDDPLTTNICFGGEDLRTAYMTLSASGRLVAADWSRPGLQLAF